MNLNNNISLTIRSHLTHNLTQNRQQLNKTNRTNNRNHIHNNIPNIQNLNHTKHKSKTSHTQGRQLSRHFNHSRQKLTTTRRRRPHPHTVISSHTLIKIRHNRSLNSITKRHTRKLSLTVSQVTNGTIHLSRSLLTTINTNRRLHPYPHIQRHRHRVVRHLLTHPNTRPPTYITRVRRRRHTKSNRQLTSLTKLRHPSSLNRYQQRIIRQHPLRPPTPHNTKHNQRPPNNINRLHLNNSNLNGHNTTNNSNLLKPKKNKRSRLQRRRLNSSQNLSLNTRNLISLNITSLRHKRSTLTRRLTPNRTHLSRVTVNLQLSPITTRFLNRLHRIRIHPTNRFNRPLIRTLITSHSPRNTNNNGLRPIIRRHLRHNITIYTKNTRRQRRPRTLIRLMLNRNQVISRRRQHRQAHNPRQTKHHHHRRSHRRHHLGGPPRHRPRHYLTHSPDTHEHTTPRSTHPHYHPQPPTQDHPTTPATQHQYQHTHPKAE